MDLLSRAVIYGLDSSLALRPESFLMGACLLTTLLNLLYNEENILFTSFCPFMRILSHWTLARSLLNRKVQDFEKSRLLTVLRTVLSFIDLAMQN